LINRFDILFTMRDLPNRENDSNIAAHVLEEHQKQGEGMYIPRELFRKYIAFAKQKIKPVLSEEAVEEIKRFYVELRNGPTTSESSQKSIPSSARQLQALIRMSEASAKIRLSLNVSKDDARRAIELMKYFLIKVGYDYESKTFDIDRISGKFTSSQRGKIFGVREVIFQLKERLGEMIPIEEIEKELEGKMSKREIEESIDKLKSEGTLFEPRRGFVGVAK
jgi:replicative DNA helicase Mcm